MSESSPVQNIFIEAYKEKYDYLRKLLNTTDYDLIVNRLIPAEILHFIKSNIYIYAKDGKMNINWYGNDLDKKFADREKGGMARYKKMQGRIYEDLIKDPYVREYIYEYINSRDDYERDQAMYECVDYIIQEARQYYDRGMLPIDFNTDSAKIMEQYMKY